MTQHLFVTVLLLFSHSVHAYDAIYDGDVYVDALLTVFGSNNGHCGEIESESVQSIEALKWTFSRLNGENYIGDVNLGLRFHKTCRSADRANWIAFELSQEQSKENRNHTVMGVIGPTYSSEAQLVSSFFTGVPESLELLQISYSATSASLSDKSRYNNFFRTVPPDDIQIEAMFQFMRTLNWTYVALFYDNDTYGQGGAAGLQEIAVRGDICFPVTFAIDHNLPANDTYKQVLIELQQVQARNIYGIVIFGSSKLANALLDASSTLLTEPNGPHSSGSFRKPTFLFSEATGFFEDRETSKFNILKGAFVVSPAKRVIQEFDDYWRNIFKDMARLSAESKSNPWLIDIFEKATDCRPGGATNCSELNDTEITEFFPQTIYTQYAIQTALIMAKVIKLVYNDLCSTNELCQQFISASKDIFVQRMRNLQVNFDRDFFSIDAFGNPDDLLVSFDGSADVELDPKFPTYEVYNYRQCRSGSGSFCFEKVADYFSTTGKLNIETNEIRHYSGIGEQLDDIEIREAQCPSGYVCTDCITSTTKSLMHVPGDMYIVGIAPVHDKSDTPLKCGKVKPGGLDIVEAIRYAVNESKIKFNDVPNADIGVIVIDSCNDPDVLKEKLFILNRYGIETSSSFTPVKDKILGYIGAWISDNSIATSEILQRLKYVQISYASTAPILSNRVLHPTFMRVTSSDDQQAKVILEIVQQLNADVIQIIHSDTAYGNGGKSAITDFARNASICVAQTISVPQTSDVDYEEIIAKVKKIPDAKLVVLFLSSFDTNRMIASINTIPEFVTVASEGWGTRDILDGYQDLKGAITVANELPTDSKFNVYMKSLRTGSSDTNPWLREYMEDYFGCYYQWSFNKTGPRLCGDDDILDPYGSYKVETWVPYTENAVYALLRGAGKTLEELCGSSLSICRMYLESPDYLIEQIKLVQLSWDLKNRKPLFNSNGDGLTPYSIYVVGDDETGSGRLTYFSIGTGGQGNIQFDLDKWTQKNGGSVSSRCASSSACNACPFHQTPIQEEEYDDRPGLIAAMVVFILISVGLGAVVILLVWKIRHMKPQESPYATYLSPVFEAGERHVSGGSMDTASLGPGDEKGYITAGGDDKRYITAPPLDENTSVGWSVQSDTAADRAQENTASSSD